MFIRFLRIVQLGKELGSQPDPGHFSYKALNPVELEQAYGFF